MGVVLGDRPFKALRLPRVGHTDNAAGIDQFAHRPINRRDAKARQALQRGGMELGYGKGAGRFPQDRLDRLHLSCGAVSHGCKSEKQDRPVEHKICVIFDVDKPLSILKSYPDQMKTLSLSLIRSAVLAIIPLTAITTTRAQTVPVVLLDEMVVSAQRASHRIAQTPSAITLVPLEETRTAGEYALDKVLSKQPGTLVVSSGAVGSQTSVYMRGANSHQTLFFVNGVRMNDKGTAYFNFLGAANTTGVGRMEVLRGPQSTLYGSSAMGGVIAIDTTHGVVGTTGSLVAEYGSFNTFAASAEVAGGVQSLGYSLSVARDQTDNDRENNAFESWTYSGRFEGQITETVTIGATLRGLTSTYEEPGSTLASFPSEGTAETDDHLLTAYGEWQASDGFKSRLIGGLHRRDYVWISEWGNSPSQNDRRILAWLHTSSVSSALELVGGRLCQQCLSTG